MKTKHHRGPVVMRCQAAAFALTAFALTGLSSCSQEDAALQLQLIEARSALDIKSKALEKAEADLARTQSHTGDVVSTEEAAKLKSRNSDLEDQLAAARAQASGSSGAPQFDMEAMAVKLEDDLTVKAKQLRELVQKQTNAGKVDEISLKAISYPAEIVTPFSSSITFSMIMEGGKSLRLMFPVTADLSGVWKLPGPDEVQKALDQAQSQPQQLAAGAPAAAGSPATPAAQAAASGGAGASMRQVDGNTFVFNWGDGSAAPPQAQPRAAAPQPVAAAPAAPAPVAGLPRPAAPAAPQQPAAAAAPAAVMPVQRDVVIKFD